MSDIMDIRVGDVWGFRTNNCVLLREIKIIGETRVGYSNPGCNVIRACLKTTFRRWLKGASLQSAKDWNNRINI